MNQKLQSTITAGVSLLENFLIHAVANDDRERALRIATKLPGTYAPVLLAAANPALFYAIAMLMSWGDAHAGQAVRLVGPHVYDGPIPLGDRIRDAMFGAAAGMAESALHSFDLHAAEQFFVLAAVQPERIPAYSKSLCALAKPLVTAVADLERGVAKQFPQFRDPAMIIPSFDQFQKVMGADVARLGLIGRLIALLDTHGYTGPAAYFFKVALEHCEWPSWRALEFYAVRQPYIVIRLASGELQGEVNLGEGARKHLGAFAKLALRTITSVPEPSIT